MCPSVPILRDGTGEMIIPHHVSTLPPNNSPLKPLHRNLKVKAIISMD